MNNAQPLAKLRESILDADLALRELNLAHIPYPRSVDTLSLLHNMMLQLHEVLQDVRQLREIL